MPEIVRERIDWELDAIIRNGYSSKYVVAKSITDNANKDGYFYSNRGAIASSFVAYLLGISEINPLQPHYLCGKCHYSEFHSKKFCGADMIDKNCPTCDERMIKDGFNIPGEMFMGLDGNKNQDICLNLDRDCYSMNENKFNINLLTHDNLDIMKKLYDATKINPKDIPIGDKKTMNLFKNADTQNIPEFETDYVRNMLKLLNAQRFDDLIRISGLSHGSGNWIDNGEKFVAEGKSIYDIISSRDDVVTYLVQKGLDRKTAYEIAMEIIRTKNISEEHCKLMRSVDVPEWYIESCKQIRYLFPRAHCTTYVLMAYRIAYYKAHYPEEFETVIYLHNKK